MNLTQSRRPNRPLSRGLVRRLGLERNDLRRRADRCESAILLTLLIAFLVGLPLLGVFSVRSAYASGLHAEQAQAARHRVVAQLLADVSRRPQPSFVENGTQPRVLVLARWTHAGTVHVGQVQAVAGSKAGSTVTVWVDGRGHIAGAPQTRTQTVWSAGFAGVGSVCVLALGLWVMWRLVGWASVRRQLAAWEADWAVTAAEWTRRR